MVGAGRAIAVQRVEKTARSMTWTTCRSVFGVLTENHYLGPIGRGWAWKDEFGVIVVAPPTSRRLPGHWLELSRWCLVRGVKNDGSRQWASFLRALRRTRPEVTTIVSYSDPSAGHTGALYRACNWWWAPTWMRLRPPPSGGGSWDGEKQEAVKDRWVFPVAPDIERAIILRAQDDAILRRWPWAEYREPGGVPWKKWQARLTDSTEK
jgi:hypothetical protein